MVEKEKILAALIATIEGSGGICLWNPLELMDKLKELEDCTNDRDLIDKLSDPERDLYEDWLIRYAKLMR